MFVISRRVGPRIWVWWRKSREAGGRGRPLDRPSPERAQGLQRGPWSSMESPGSPRRPPGAPLGPCQAGGRDIAANPSGCAAWLREAQFMLVGTGIHRSYVVPPQRRVAILGVCACESGPAVPPDFPRTARAVPVPVPCRAVHVASVAATEGRRVASVDATERGAAPRGGRRPQRGGGAPREGSPPQDGRRRPQSQ